MESDVNPAPLSTEQAPAEVVTEAAPVVSKPGEKTDPALLLESLRKEREEKKRLREELEAERTKNQQPPEVFSDEGKTLLTKISSLESKLAEREQNEVRKSLQTQYPALSDKAMEFEQYLQDNPGMRIDTAAKAFLTENDLLETPKPRRGLETPSGGGRTAPQPDGLTASEVDDLRNNNYREYVRRLKAGTLKIRNS
jgi:hypothetical protein